MSVAATNGHTDLVELLLEAKADVNRQGKGAEVSEATPLYSAAHNNAVDAMKLLLEGKAEVNRANELGMTALHSAAINGKHEVVRLLTQANASLDSLNKNGSTALHLAALKGHAATCQVLVEAGADAAIRSQYYKGEFKDDETAKEEQEGATALQIAEKKRHRDIVALLG